MNPHFLLYFPNAITAGTGSGQILEPGVSHVSGRVPGIWTVICCPAGILQEGKKIRGRSLSRVLQYGCRYPKLWLNPFINNTHSIQNPFNVHEEICITCVFFFFFNSLTSIETLTNSIKHSPETAIFFSFVCFHSNFYYFFCSAHLVFHLLFFFQFCKTQA